MKLFKQKGINTLSLLASLKLWRSGSKGFTLIELLVVIGILGILAAALVATIDPFEQLKKANDANIKNTAVEFTNSNIRYYTTHSAMPWAVDTAGCGAAAGMATTGPTTTVTLNSVAGTCVSDIIADGELKTAFTSVTSVLTSILITGGTNSVTACFAPASKAQKNDLNTKYIYQGGQFVTAACVAGMSGANTCYWCAQ